MWLIWLKFYLGTHYYVLLTYAKNQDFMLRLKLFLRPIKTILRRCVFFFYIFPIFSPITHSGRSDKSVTVVDITSTCTLCL